MREDLGRRGAGQRFRARSAAEARAAASDAVHRDLGRGSLDEASPPSEARAVARAAGLEGARVHPGVGVEELQLSGVQSVLYHK
jgi:hypothetical protein